jgi:hypothetical protein
MFGCCCLKKKVELKLEPPRYVEPRASAVELVKYEKIIGELSDTSCEPVMSPTPTPPPRDRERISFLVNDKEDNSIKSSEDESLFNISVNHSILSEKFGNGSFNSGNVRILSGKDEDKDLRDRDREIEREIEPIITVNISIKNERNGVLIHRKIYL